MEVAQEQPLDRTYKLPVLLTIALLIRSYTLLWDGSAPLGLDK
jgi:hypothetical protein